MELISKGRRLELRVDGYQYLDPITSANELQSRLSVEGANIIITGDNKYDRNWLMIHCDVAVPRGHWSFSHPCMLTWDVQRWSEWLDDIAANRTDERYVLGYEYVIALKFVDVTTDLFHLVVEFREEGRPPWITKRIYSVPFYVPVRQIHAAAESLREDLRRFPPRDPNPFVKLDQETFIEAKRALSSLGRRKRG